MASVANACNTIHCFMTGAENLTTLAMNTEVTTLVTFYITHWWLAFIPYVMLNWPISLWNLPIFLKYNAAAIAKITQLNNVIYNVSLFQKVAYFKKNRSSAYLFKISMYLSSKSCTSEKQFFYFFILEEASRYIYTQQLISKGKKKKQTQKSIILKHWFSKWILI